MADGSGFFDEAFVQSELLLKFYVGTVTGYGKIIALTAGLENLGGLQSDAYVAEDMVGMLATLRYRMRAQLFGFIEDQKGMGNSFLEMLKPFRKWSGDAWEILFGPITQLFFSSSNVHWTAKLDTLEGLSFYFKKPAVYRLTISILVVFYFLDLNPFFGLPFALFVNSLVLAQAIGGGAYMVYIHRHGWVWGTIRYAGVMVKVVFILATAMTPQYADAVSKGVRKHTRFVLTGGKGGPLSRFVVEELYINAQYSIIPGVILTLMVLFFSSFDPIKVTVWGMSILTVMVGWWLGPLLLNPHFTWKDRVMTLFYIPLTMVWALTDTLVNNWFRIARWGLILFGLAATLNWYFPTAWVGMALLGIGIIAPALLKKYFGIHRLSLFNLWGKSLYYRGLAARKDFDELGAKRKKGEIFVPDSLFEPMKSIAEMLRDYNGDPADKVTATGGMFNSLGSIVVGKAKYQAPVLVHLLRVRRLTMQLNNMIIQAKNPAGIEKKLNVWGWIGQPFVWMGAAPRFAYQLTFSNIRAWYYASVGILLALVPSTSALPPPMVTEQEQDHISAPLYRPEDLERIPAMVDMVTHPEKYSASAVSKAVKEIDRSQPLGIRDFGTRRIPHNDHRSQVALAQGIYLSGDAIKEKPVTIATDLIRGTVRESVDKVIVTPASNNIRDLITDINKVNQAIKQNKHDGFELEVWLTKEQEPFAKQLRKQLKDLKLAGHVRLWSKLEGESDPNKVMQELLKVNNNGQAKSIRFLFEQGADLPEYVGEFMTMLEATSALQGRLSIRMILQKTLQVVPISMQQLSDLCKMSRLVQQMA
jgi:hypothetical protein